MYIRIHRIPKFYDVPMATVNRHAGIDFQVFNLKQKVRLAKRVDIERWIESKRCFLGDDAEIETPKKRRRRLTKGASTPELDATHEEALRAYERFMES